MNMSHVERYFADFLSAMESINSSIYLHSSEEIANIPKNINLPKNLFIIGTVNIDETTYMFSPKVLDRANVIEFRIEHDQMRSFISSQESINFNDLIKKGSNMGQDFVETCNETIDIKQDLSNELINFFSSLQEIGSEFGYRVVSEISRFVYFYQIMTNDPNSAIDAAISQKLLPKIHGSRNKLDKTLNKLASCCLNDDVDDPFEDIIHSDIKFPVSYEKIKRMHFRLLEDGFTSFAEA